jgi:ABC-type dipeptide/oligopeptide/nickel transport system permease component
MRKYIVKRLLLFIPTLLGVSIAIFCLLRVLPGDPAAVVLGGPSGDASYTQEDLQKLRVAMGLDRPLYIQYMSWIGDVFQGDLGESYITRRPVWQAMKQQLPVTLQLAAFTACTIVVLGIPIGIIAALRQDSWLDLVLRGWAILGQAMPTFFLGLLVLLVLSKWAGWLPPAGFTNLWDNPQTSVQQLLLPAIALGLGSNGTLVRMMRTQLLEVLREDYIRTAYAKGLKQRMVVWRHAVRNAMLPVVTVFGFQIGGLLSGTVVIEQVFSLPGVGGGMVSAINSRDLTVIQVYVLYFASLALVVNLLVDLSYAWLDPRIRYE